MQSHRKPKSGHRRHDPHPIQIWGGVIIFSAFAKISFLPFENDGSICLVEVEQPKRPQLHFKDNCGLQ